MSDTSAELSRIASTLELADGLALIFVVGPDFRAPEGLSLIRAGLPNSRPTLWHRLDRDGPDVVTAVERVQMDEPIVLVHGLENLEEEARASVESSLNMLRDRLALVRAALLLWVPRSDLDSFQRHCADLLAWRSLLVSLSEEQVSIDPVLEARRIYLSQLRAELERRSALALAPLRVQPEFLSDRMVLPEAQQAAIPLSEWIKRTQYGILIGEAGGGKTTALMALAILWAREAAEAPHGAPCPLFVTARDLYRGPTFGLNLDEEEMPVTSFSRARFAEWARTGELVLMLDGLDELEEPARKLCSDWLKRLRSRYPRLRMILASRTRLHEFRSPWTHARLEPLSFAQLRAHLGELAQAPQQPVLEAVLVNLEALQKSRTNALPVPSNLLIRLILASGLGVALLASKSRTGLTASPSALGMLLGTLTNLLLKGEGGQRPPPSGQPNLRALRLLLSSLAAGALARGTDEVLEEDISRVYRRMQMGGGFPMVPATPEAAAQMLHEASRQFPWIIAQIDTRRFRFAHPLFQAFFAAEHFTNLWGPSATARFLSRNLAQPQWRTVSVMAAGQFARRGVTEARKFINELLRVPVSRDEIEMRRLALALDCARAAQLPAQETSEWRARAEQLCRTAPRSEEEKAARKELCDALERLQEPRRST